LSAIDEATPLVMGLLQEIVAAYDDDDSCKMWLK
jgi:hypothetical protein